MGRTITVCVVDDDVETASILCEGLKLHEYNVFEVHTGQEALDICAKERIDLLLLDVGLADIDGYEVCKRLKESPATKNIAVMFVTVKDEYEDIERGYQLGAVDYVTKPYNLPMVMVRVDAALYGRKGDDSPHLNTDIFMDVGSTDHLTGLRNRRYLLDRLQEEVSKAHRYDYPVSCVMIDVDEIHAVDSESGPVSVDDLLSEVAITLRSQSRAYDVLARYDGTLFAALLPHTVLEDAIEYSKKIIEEMDSTTFSDPNFPTKATVSIGIVTCQNGSAKGADVVFGEAMRSLLEAKARHPHRIVGRNLR